MSKVFEFSYFVCRVPAPVFMYFQGISNCCLTWVVYPTIKYYIGVLLASFDLANYTLKSLSTHLPVLVYELIVCVSGNALRNKDFTESMYMAQWKYNATEA